MPLSTPSSTAWNDVLKGSAFDASNDEGSNSSSDLVGNSSNAVLQAQLAGSGDTALLYFRARLAETNATVSVMLGLDLNGDGRFDVFVEANFKETPAYVSLHRRDPTKSDLSPSTTGWLNSSSVTTSEQKLSAANIYLGTNAAGTDIDVDGKTDGWLEFGFKFSDLKAFAQAALGIDTLTMNSTVSFALFTSDGSQAITGDVAGINDKTSSNLTTSWTALGIETTSTLTAIASGTPAAPTNDPLSTSNTTPTITGTWGGSNGGGDTLSVTVNGATYTTATTPALTITNNNWSLRLPSLATGSYAVTASVTRGRTTVSNTTPTTLSIVAAGDTTAPTLLTLVPTDNATGVAVDSNFVLTFSETVVAGAGLVTLNQGSNVVEMFNLRTGLGSAGGTATIAGGTVTINPGALLTAKTAYYIQVATNAVLDTSGNGFAGLTTSTAYDITTATTVGTPIAPTVTALTTRSASPTIGGTWGGSNQGADQLTVSVGGTAYTTSNGLAISGNAWSLALSGMVAGTWSVTATTARTGGGSIGDATSNELVIDQTAPTIATFTTSGTGIVNGSGNLATGSVIVITLTGSEALTVTGTPSLTLNSGGTATYTGQTDATTLTFAYTVGAGQNAADLAITGLTGGITDAAGNTLDLTHLSAVGNPGGTLRIDTTPPTAPTIDLPFTILMASNVADGEAFTVGGESGSEITLTFTGTAGIVTRVNTVSGSYMTAILTEAELLSLGEGLVTMSAIAADAAGNTSAAGIGSFVLDTIPPAIVSFTMDGPGIVAGDGVVKAGDVVTITLLATETLVVGDTPVLNLSSGGVATYTGGAGTTSLTFSYKVGSGENTTDLAVTGVSGTITGNAGNPLDLTNLAAVGNPAGTVHVDTAAPTATTQLTGAGIAGGAGHLKSGQTVTITLTADHTMTVTGTPTLTVSSGGTATYIGGSGSAILTFDYVVADGENTANLTVTAVNGTITDHAGNPLTADLIGAPAETVLIDTIAPSTPVVHVPVATMGSTEAARDEAFTIVGDNGTAISVTFSGTTGTIIRTGTVAGSDFTTTLSAADLAGLGDGTVAISATATDAAGNTSTAGTNSFTLDTIAPAITAIDIAGAGIVNGAGTLKAGDVVAISLTGTEPMMVGHPTFLTLSGGGTATYASGTGTAVLTFTYTVAAGEDTADLTITGLTGTVTGAAGNPLDRTSLTPLLNPAGLLVVDTTAPTIAGIDVSGTGIVAGNGTVGLGDTVTFTLTGSEPLIVSGTPTLALSNGTTAIYTAGTGTTYLTFVYTVGSADPHSAGLTIAAINGTITDTAGNALETSAIATSGGPSGTLQVACFAAGTHLATPDGARRVEDLRPGDLLLNHRGDARPIRWIGHRHLDLTRPDPSGDTHPITIRANALADGVPVRDLRVSPEHAMFLSEGLVPARFLVNGTSIVQDLACDAVTYFHIELDSHDILLAEGAASESYLDTGNRTMFTNADTAQADRDTTDAQATRLARSCARFIDQPDMLEALWNALAARAARLGMGRTPAHPTTHDPDPMIAVGGRLVPPLCKADGRFVFVLPASDTPPRLLSRAAEPNLLHPWIADRRTLGLLVRRITVRHGDASEALPLDHPSLSNGHGANGWWAIERDGPSIWRWTTGDAHLPIALHGPAVIEIEAGALPAYPLSADNAEAMGDAA